MYGIKFLMDKLFGLHVKDHTSANEENAAFKI